MALPMYFIYQIVLCIRYYNNQKKWPRNLEEMRRGGEGRYQRHGMGCYLHDIFIIIAYKLHLCINNNSHELNITILIFHS